jgi:hypothetical protein
MFAAGFGVSNFVSTLVGILTKFLISVNFTARIAVSQANIRSPDNLAKFMPCKLVFKA